MTGRPPTQLASPYRGWAAVSITHHLGLDKWDKAYDVFSRAADTGALKVVLSR